MFAESSDGSFKEFVRECIVEIDSKSTGQLLLNKISEHLKELPSIEIVINDVTGEGRTEFSHRLENRNFDQNGYPNVTLNQLTININLDDGITVCTGKGEAKKFSSAECLGKTIQLGDTRVFQVANAYSPFYIVIAHELIHLKHFLEACSKKTGSLAYGIAIKVDKYALVQNYQEIKELPELQELVLLNKVLDEIYPDTSETKIKLKSKVKLWTINNLIRTIPWLNYEERRTVLGPDIDGISELKIRLENDLPIRYIYQTGTNPFYESEEVVHSILEQAGIKDIDNALQRVTPPYIDNASKCKDHLGYAPITVRLTMVTQDNSEDKIFLNNLLSSPLLDEIKKVLNAIKEEYNKK